MRDETVFELMEYYKLIHYTLHKSRRSYGLATLGQHKCCACPAS